MGASVVAQLAVRRLKVQGPAAAVTGAPFWTMLLHPLPRPSAWHAEGRAQPFGEQRSVLFTTNVGGSRRDGGRAGWDSGAP